MENTASGRSVRVLIEKYNRHPETPLHGVALIGHTRYRVEFTRDGEEVHLKEDHSHENNMRKIGIHDRREIDVTTKGASVSISDKGNDPGDPELQLRLDDELCFKDEKMTPTEILQYQAKCLGIAATIINELYSA